MSAAITLRSVPSDADLTFTCEGQRRRVNVAELKLAGLCWLEVDPVPDQPNAYVRDLPPQFFKKYCLLSERLDVPR